MAGIAREPALALHERRDARVELLQRLRPDRDRAVACADCAKLIIPTTSPYLPKEVCYHCHLAREDRAKLRAPPSDRTSYRAINVVPTGEGPPGPSFSCGAESAPAVILAELAQQVRIDLDYARDHLLTSEDVAHTLEVAVGEVESRLESHQPLDPSRRHPFARPVEWRGRELLLDRPDTEHQRLGDLILVAKVLDAANAAGRSIRVFTTAGIKYRDFKLLWNLVGSSGSAIAGELIEQWAEPFGSRGAVEESIARLVAAGCLTVVDSRLEATEKGRAIWTSDEGG